MPSAPARGASRPAARCFSPGPPPCSSARCGSWAAPRARLLRAPPRGPSTAARFTPTLRRARRHARAAATRAPAGAAAGRPAVGGQRERRGGGHPQTSGASLWAETRLVAWDAGCGRLPSPAAAGSGAFARGLALLASPDAQEATLLRIVNGTELVADNTRGSLDPARAGACSRRLRALPRPAWARSPRSWTCRW